MSMCGERTCNHHHQSRPSLSLNHHLPSASPFIGPKNLIHSFTYNLKSSSSMCFGVRLAGAACGVFVVIADEMVRPCGGEWARWQMRKLSAATDTFEIISPFQCYEQVSGCGIRRKRKTSNRLNFFKKCIHGIV